MIPVPYGGAGCARPRLPIVTDRHAVAWIRHASYVDPTTRARHNDGIDGVSRRVKLRVTIRAEVFNDERHGS